MKIFYLAGMENTMVDQRNNVIYREVQRWSVRFRCFLLVLLMLTVVVCVLATAIEIIHGSARLGEILVIISCGVLVPLGIAYLIWVSRLETEVRQDSLCVRYFPFHRSFRIFKPDELSECRARNYRPLLEYGGWGIRWGPKGRAYNVSGHEGVQLVFKNGKRLLIGSAKPRELEAAIRSIV